jgi:hypothetical protein
MLSGAEKDNPRFGVKKDKGGSVDHVKIDGSAGGDIIHSRSCPPACDVSGTSHSCSRLVCGGINPSLKSHDGDCKA